MLSIATQLHTHASSLADQAKDGTTFDEALQKKAGENDTTPGTLRYLARLLYDAAEALRVAVNTGDGNAASNLATEVGANESTSNKLREKLKELASAQAGDLTGPANAVKTQYDDVSQAFKAVENQNKAGAYNTGDKQPLYQAVVDAWEAFNTLYNANLKGLAKELGTAVGQDDNTGETLRVALNALSTASDKTPQEKGELVEKAKEVIKKFNEIVAAYDKVNAFAETYKVINATSSHYNIVESKFDELQQATKLKAAAGDLSEKAQRLHVEAESLAGQLGAGNEDAQKLATALKDAASKPDGGDREKGLEQLLDELNSAEGIVSKVKDKETEYKKALEDTVGGKDETQKYTEVTSAFDELNTELKGQLNNISLIYNSRETSGHLTKIRSKTRTLKTTVSDQSTIELTSTYLTDLQQHNNFPQSKLKDKATDLAGKASTLHGAAADLESAAQPSGSPLAALSSYAGSLKAAAKSENGSTGLYKAANDLATRAAQKNQPANIQATAVITEFDKVETQYDALIKAANTSKLTNNPAVIAVVKAYLEVKTTYYQMLIIYRIKNKADAFHTAAQALQSAAENAATQITNPLLAALHDAANGEMDNLVTTANQLKNIALSATDSTIVAYYLAVAEKYKELEVKEQFTAAKDELQVQAVTEKFEALQKSYVNVLRLRVQELSNLAHKLSTDATALSGDVPELREKANALKDAASNTDHGLKEKATALREAINGTTGGDPGTKATAVITQFDIVTNKYNELMEKAKEKGKQNELNVKAVTTAYTDLKEVYDSILNVTKIKHYATEIYSEAPQIATGNSVTKPSEVKTLIDMLQNVYNSMPADIKHDFQNDFESIKNVVCGVHLDKKYMRCFSIFWTLCNL